jgi:hypothetical protein
MLIIEMKKKLMAAPMTSIGAISTKKLASVVNSERI